MTIEMVKELVDALQRRATELLLDEEVLSG